MICSEEHCSRIAAYTYNYEGPKGVCAEHLQVVQFRLTALGKMGPMHPSPVVFHREIGPMTPNEEQRQRIRDLEAQLATLIDAPQVIESLTVQLDRKTEACNELLQLNKRLEETFQHASITASDALREVEMLRIELSRVTGLAAPAPEIVE